MNKARTRFICIKPRRSCATHASLMSSCFYILKLLSEVLLGPSLVRCDALETFRSTALAVVCLYTCAVTNVSEQL